jgi:glutamate--cysteine ligase
MMKRTATVQVNLDYGDGDDAREKIRCLMSVTSLLTAIYANSPIVDGQVSEFASYRAEIWRFTDPDRCGLLPFAFEDGCMFRRYTEWALDVPMFFVYRGGYVPARGTTFRQFMHNGFDGHHATIDDWALHLSTLFPEARLKKFLEVRGCDSGSVAMICALGPLSRGLLYDSTGRSEATALTARLDFAERLDLQRDVARRGLAATLGGSSRTVGELAKELVAIAADGLRREAPDEIPLLEPLREIVETGRMPAASVVDLWQHEPDTSARIAALAHPLG